MPSTSKKQAKFMAAAAHNPAFATAAGIPPKVAKEFNRADKGRKFKEGGALKQTDAESNPGLAKLPTDVRNKMGYMKKGGDVKMDMAQDKKMVKKAVGMHEKQLHGGKKSDMTKLKSGGMTCGSKMKKYAAGGKTRGCGMATKGLTKGKMV